MPTTSPKLTLSNAPTRWYPYSVTGIETHLGFLLVNGTTFPEDKLSPLKKNLTYNLQYIEFLDRVIKDISLTSVLQALNIKSFVIHSAAVIEGIYNYLVISTGNGNSTQWQSSKKFQCSPYAIDTNTFMHETEVFIKLASHVITEMTFDQLAKKVESKKL